MGSNSLAPELIAILTLNLTRYGYGLRLKVARCPTASRRRKPLFGAPSSSVTLTSGRSGTLISRKNRGDDQRHAILAGLLTTS